MGYADELPVNVETPEPCLGDYPEDPWSGPLIKQICTDEFSEYSIYTIDGQVIKSGSVSKKIEIAELNTGLYYLIISKDKKIFYSKFIKI